MHQPNFVSISIIIGVIQVVLDLYVLWQFQRFVQRQKMNVWWSRSMWILGAAMFMVYLYVAVQRHFFRMSTVDAALFMVVSLWLLPKIVVVPVLLVRDLVAGVRWIIRRMRGNVKHPDAPRPAVLDMTPDTNEQHTQARRAFLAKAGWATAVIPYAIVGDGIFRTLYDFKVYSHDVVLANLPRAFDGMRVLQISDVHAGSFPDHRPFQEARRIIESIKPDVILITGDFVNFLPNELSVIAKELSALHAPMGVYASLGNHDHYNQPTEHARLVSAVRGFDIDLLVNDLRRLRIGNDELVIAGIDNTGFKQHFGDLGKALHGVTEEDAVILLAHDPTFWDKEVRRQAPVGLTLSGHTHGGQFGVQLLGFEWSPAQYVYKQWAGMYSDGDQHLYVNRGLGTVGPPIRIGINPEITVFTLRSAPTTA